MPTIDLPDDELNASAAKHVLVCASIWFTRFLPCRERRSASRRQPSRVPDALTAGRAKSTSPMNSCPRMSPLFIVGIRPSIK